MTGDTRAPSAHGVSVSIRALHQRFLFSQTFAQRDPWAERADGADAHEFAPLAPAG